ncbi:MAG: glutamyl-tRNA reductase [Bacteroidota bacterium]|nr:glutamyl-tRNA reductase [Bacteroidota bacterium]
MTSGKTSYLQNFFIAGLNYKNANEPIRGRFAINFEQYDKILKLAPSYGIDNLMILSTCNRTEIYGFSENASQLIQLLCSQTVGCEKEFNDLAYIEDGLNAAKHLYNVASGLDSQILGDYEITGQLRKAISFSRDHNFIGTTFDRLLNSVLKSTKKIKTVTSLSDGSVSVSFAAVKYIKESSGYTNKNKILVLGIGKIGSNTCKNLINYFGTSNITVINRTDEKAFELARKLNLRFAPMHELPDHIETADIIIVATHATSPVILKSFLTDKGNKLVIDLSIPSNVEDGAGSLPNITLINVDRFSKIKDDSLKKREAEIPKATTIIDEHIDEFFRWHAKYSQRNTLATMSAA